MGIEAEVLLHQQGESLHPLAHIRVAHGDPNPSARWYHRSACKAAVTKVGEALARAKGPALPKLKTLLSTPATSWTKIVVSACYGHAGGKALEITSDIALWYRPGAPVLPVRWGLVRDPDAKRDPQAFFSTDVSLEPADIIALYVRRWQIEVTFAETRAPGRRDTAPMERQRHSANYPGTPGFIQPRIAMGRRSAHQQQHPLCRRVVLKNQSDVH